jgi:hypothetical protein
LGVDAAHLRFDYALHVARTGSRKPHRTNLWDKYLSLIVDRRNGAGLNETPDGD